MKKVILVVVLTIATTGCTGMEIGTKAWIHRVDEAQSSQQTYRKATPLKCYLWADCGSSAGSAGSANNDEIKGS